MTQIQSNTSEARRDPLLTAVKTLIIIPKVLLGICIVSLGIALPIMLASNSHVRENLLPEAAGNLGVVLFASSVAILIAIAMLAMTFRFLQLLEQLIGTVREGDPFVPANAIRLSRMAWLVLVIQGIAIPMTLLAAWLASQFPEGTIYVDSVFSLGGIALALVLFVLARVFRHGAAMREDLEGTV